jgi:hypothetical protein
MYRAPITVRWILDRACGHQEHTIVGNLSLCQRFCWLIVAESPKYR